MSMDMEDLEELAHILGGRGPTVAKILKSKQWRVRQRILCTVLWGPNTEHIIRLHNIDSMTTAMDQRIRARAAKFVAEYKRRENEQVRQPKRRKRVRSA